MNPSPQKCGLKCTRFRTTIHKDGWKFIFISVLLTFYCLMTWPFLFYPLSVLTIWIIYFFRDPKPYLPVNKKIIVSPATGKVVLIQQVAPPKEFELGNKTVTRISIFLSPMDVHINRAPMKCTVTKTLYHKGQFFNASLDKASEQNERNAILLKYGDKKMAVVQIAGFIARRIVCPLKPTQQLEIGQELGLIRFGSRVDVYFDSIIEPFVQVGQRVHVGETALYEI